MDEYMGIVKLFAGTFAPRGWEFCNGQLLPLQQNSALFALLGTQFGGDGIVNFGLPDLRGAVPVGPGAINGVTYIQGDKGGSASVSLVGSNLPPHVHTGEGTISVSASNSTDATPKAGSSIGIPGSNISRVFTPTLGFVTAAPSVNLKTNIATGATVNANQLPVSVLQPFQAINYIICVQGIFPPRP